MRVCNNYIYDDLILKYSRTARLSKSRKINNPVNFDSVLAESAKIYSQKISPEKDACLTFTYRNFFINPDTLLIETARAYSQAKNKSDSYDSVLHGEIS